MRRIFLLFIFLFSIISSGQKNPKTIGFIENKGQIVDQKGKVNKAVNYLLNTPGLNVQLRNNGFSYDIYETKKIPLSKKDKNFGATNFKNEKDTPDFSLEYNYHRIDIDFLNSNANVKLLAEEKSSDYDNYYNVAHAPEGITNVHKYQKVTYQNIYTNIDAVFFIPKDTTKVVEYNFIVKPGGKVSDIQLKFNGAKTELTDNKIKMKVRFGEMEETLPLSWIEQGTSRKEIVVGYKNLRKNVYGFEGDMNASDKIIVIDPVPVRLWGTFYGSEGYEVHNRFGDLESDSSGNIYFVGHTFTSNSLYATSGAHQVTIGNSFFTTYDGIIAKFNSSGNRVWGTYYGGSEYDLIKGIKIDTQNNIVIVGQTNSSTNISTTNPKSNFDDAFLAKFSPSGVRIWGRYFGGDKDDIGYDVDIDSNNAIYIVGSTMSFNGISINNNFQTMLNHGMAFVDNTPDGFLSKFDSNGNTIWSTYVGGEKFDQLYTIKVTPNSIVMGGLTFSYNYISTPGASQQNYGYSGVNNWDGMAFKFTLNGSRIWSTYYGGDDGDTINSVTVDDEDNVYLTGQTLSSNNIATPGMFDSYNLYSEIGFLAKLDSNGQRHWGTYIGNTRLNLHSVKFNNGCIYVAGHGGGDTSITLPCSYKNYSHSDSYLGKFSTNGNLLMGTYIGAHDPISDIETKICFDSSNNIIVGGTAGVNDGISDSNSYQPTILGYRNFYLIKFSESSACNINVNPISNSPVCIGGVITLNSAPGYNYSWTGPNGFSSNLQNPTINNVSSLNSGMYTLVISDNCNCQETYNLNVVVADTEAPIPVIQNLATINGDCNTVISTIPTATDNCAGTISATTTNPLSYSLPGTYTIVWNYNDGNGNTTTQNQTVIVSATATPIVNANYYFCPNQTPSLSDITITGQNIKWYDALSGGNLLANTTLLQNGVTYYASQTINGCESTRVPVTVTIQNTPAPTGNTVQSFCSSQNATINDIAVSGSNLIWYAGATGTIVLPSTTLLSNNTAYYATQTVNGCESPTRFSVTATLINTLNANDYAETFCDDLNDGSETMDLSDFNAQLISSPTNHTFSFYTSRNSAENQTNTDEITNSSDYNLTTATHQIYVRIDSPNGCHQVVELNLTLVSKPIIPIRDIMPICEGSSIDVSAGNGFDSYTWSTAETTSLITISDPGTYSVTVTQNHGTLTCTSVKNFTVVNSNVATVAEIVTSDWTYNQNTITVLLTGSSVGNYVYSLDGIHYQTSNTFTGLESGEYIVYVKDENGCGIQPEDFYLLMYPKFFTPNGDGYNDFWRIKFSENEPNLTIKIFDRYGKLVKQLGSNSEGWNGTYNNQPLPATDYWFTVTRQNGKEYQGHFTLKR